MTIDSMVVLKDSWQKLKRDFKPVMLGFGIYGLSVFAVQLVAFVLGYIRLGLLGSIISSIFNILLSGGLWYYMLRLYREESVTLTDIFSLFQNLNLGANYVVMSVLKGILVTIGFILLVVPGVYLAVGYLFSDLLVIDKNYGFWEALEASRKAVHKNWFQFFIFSVILLILNVIGLIPLGLGLIVTIPLSIYALIAVYEEVFPL